MAAIQSSSSDEDDLQAAETCDIFDFLDECEQDEVDQQPQRLSALDDHEGLQHSSTLRFGPAECAPKHQEPTKPREQSNATLRSNESRLSEGAVPTMACHRASQGIVSRDDVSSGATVPGDEPLRAISRPAAPQQPRAGSKSWILHLIEAMLHCTTPSCS